MKSLHHAVQRSTLNLLVIMLGLFFILGSGDIVITINGDNPVTVVQGNTYIDAGATAKDDDGALDVITTGLPIDTSIVGTYEVTYTATGDDGEKKAIRKVHVVESTVVDIVPPVITITGSNPVNIIKGASYTDAGATATDNVDPAVTVITSGTVETSTVGVYKITYTAKDRAGNEAVPKIRTVNVVASSEEPDVRLDISFFGEGNINPLGNNNSITCDTPRFCTGIFKKGSTIVVEADPSTGWKFDGWKNCDSTNTTKCTITIDSNTLITTAFLSEQPLKKHDNVIVLSDSQVREITDYSHDSGILVFKSGVNIDDFKVGNILVSKGIYIDQGNAGNVEIYFAQRITRVVSLSGAPVVLTTIEASLEDIIQSGVLGYHKDINQSSLPESLPKGVSLRSSYDAKSNTIPLQIDLVLYDKDGDSNTTNDQVKAKGSIDFNVTPDFDFNFALFRGLTEFRAIMRTSSKSDLKLFIGGEVKLADGKIPVTNIPLTPVVVGFVVFIPEIAIKINYKAGVAAEIGPKLEVTTTANAGVHYLKGHGWRNIGSFDLDTKISADFEVKATAQAGPSLELIASLYGVAGPKIGMNGFVGFEIFPVIPAKNDCFFDYVGFTGINAFFGGRVSILGKELGNYEAKLFETKWNVDWATGGCSVEDKELPSSPTINIVDVTTDTVSLGWTVSTDNIGIKGYKLYRNHKIIVNTVSGTSYLDNSLKAGSEYCYYLIAVDTSGNESTISNTECAITKTLDITPPTSPNNAKAKAKSTTSIEVTWDEASDDVGVSGYIVLDNTDEGVAPYIVQQTSDLSAIVKGLTPDTEYCYIVSALDKVGNVSVATARVCATTKKPEQSKWLIKMACQGQAYNLEQNLDLDEDVSSSVSVTGTGKDYNGTNLSYSLSGAYTIDTSSLDANIIWTFEGSNKRRRDTFIADLSSDDTGNINMTQVEGTGCNGLIRFIRNTNNEALAPVIEIDDHSVADPSLNFLME